MATATAGHIELSPEHLALADLITKKVLSALIQGEVEQVDPDKLVSTRVAAEKWGKSEGHVRNLEWKGALPIKSIKSGSNIRYRLGDVLEIRRRMIEGESFQALVAEKIERDSAELN